MRIKVNGHNLYYQESGSPEGTPVIFIHGFPFDHDMWNGQAAALPPRYRCILYDVRGLGYSEVGDGQYTMEQFADDLLVMMDKLDIKQAVVCGLSMGGYIALRALEKDASRFLGLILCDTRAEADANEAKLKRAAGIKNIKESCVSKYAEESVKGVFWEESFNTKPAVIAQIKKSIEANSPLAICGCLLAMAARTDTTSILDDIKVPVMVLVGEHDTVTPPIVAQGMHEKIPSSEIHIIKDAAHMTNLENPDEFNEHLIRFLEKF